MTERRLSVVFDTNTLISAALFPKGLPRAALRQAVFAAELLTSDEALAELTEVVARDKFDKYISQEERKTFLERYRRLANVTPITEKIAACRDPKDDKFLEVAVNGAAAVIVTGDKDLLVLNPFREIRIIKARDFLETFFKTE